MNSEIFNKNLSLIKTHRPELQGLLSNKISDKIEFIKCNTGVISAKYKNKLIHSVFDPVKEASVFAKNTNISEGDCLLLYGFGLGYHIYPVLKILGKNGRLLVIEPNLELLSAAFWTIDLSSLIIDKRFQLIAGNNERDIAKRLSVFFSDDWADFEEKKKKVAIHNPSFNIIPSGFEGIQNSFEILLMERKFDVTFGKIERNNLNRNKEFVLKSSGAQRFFNKYKDRVGVLVGAGPSLDVAIHNLKALPEDCVIVSVDTSFSTLMKNGIKPDFIVTVDPQDISIRHFVEYFDEDIPLVFIPTANSRVIRCYKGEKVVIVQEKEQILGLAEIEKSWGNKGITVGGGSVSCVALDFLLKLGTSPIILTGQDCSYPNSCKYARHTVYDVDLISNMVWSKSLDNVFKREIKKDKLVYIKNRDGLGIPTHQNLYSYFCYTESIIKNSAETIYNLVSEGANIKGTKNINSIWEALNPSF